MLRVIYRSEFHIYLTALYALRRAKPILTRLVLMMTSTGFAMLAGKFARRFRTAGRIQNLAKFAAGYVGITPYVIYQKGSLEVLAL